MVHVDWEQGPDWAAMRAYRIERLTAAMKQHGLDAIMLTRLDTLRYATSFRPIYSMWFYGNRYVAMVRSSGELTFLVASGDLARVRRTMPWLTDLVSFPFAMIEGVPLIAQALRRLELGNARVGVDTFPMGVLQALQAEVPEVKLVDAMPAVDEARRIKHPVEIEMLRSGAMLADIGMQTALNFIRNGVKEVEVSAEATAAMMRAGSEDVPYYPLVVSGENLWLKYRFPTERRVRSGEMVWMDCGACIYNGYNGDIARIAFVDGQSNQEQRRIYRTIHEMLQTVSRLAGPGVNSNDLVQGVMEIVRTAGYEEFSSPVILGHGIGTDLHEAPSIGDPVKGRKEVFVGEKLEPGMVLSFEPGIIVPGVGGGHLENMMAITETGVEVLNRVPFEGEML